ncbi:Envelope fusion protein-like Protein [Tribolium castaneum]|uniref:Envelope fusion protein-like Protein n=1 Tax=Tribolium castaneum TaxID=7070 RepID=D6WF24_TRICA|nr:Envelope fusion protein-like Protein [Tribolium castaneum]
MNKSLQLKNSTSQFLKIITFSEEILRILENLETAVSFAKLKTLHNSIIIPEDLLHELKIVKENLNYKNFAFEPRKKNILLYEGIIEIKAYQKDKKLSFIFEVPLTELQNYHYYQLYPFPICSNPKSCQVIIPSHKFLFLNEYYFTLTNEKCNEVKPGDYICNLPQTKKISQDAPCEIQLLKFTQKYQDCQILHIQINDLQIQKVDKNQWIGIFPTEQPVTSICNQDEESLSIKGSYVIVVPDGCKLQMNSTTLQTYQNPDFPKIPIQLPKIEISEMDSRKENFLHLEPLELKKIDLNNLQPVYHQMQQIEETLRREDDEPISYNTNIWTILIYVLLLAVALYFLWTKCLYPRYMTRKLNQQAAASQPTPSAIPIENLDSRTIPKFPTRAFQHRGHQKPCNSYRIYYYKFRS